MAITLHINNRGPLVKTLQIEVNKTLNKRRFPWRTIRPDEIFGEDTQKAARFAGWLMGFTPEQLSKIDEGTITADTYEILTREEPSSDAMKERVEARRATAKKLRFLHQHRARKPKARGVATFDGIPVAAWMVKWLEKSRDNGWHGVLVSGFRTPQHSEELCLDMCGQPTCPSKCAGKTSNHVGLIHPAGAVDVGDEDKFAEIQPKIGSPLRNDLPSDLVHFSVSGH
jgi:hypothetical protein